MNLLLKYIPGILLFLLLHSCRQGIKYQDDQGIFLIKRYKYNGEEICVLKDSGGYQAWAVKVECK